MTGFLGADLVEVITPTLTRTELVGVNNGIVSLGKSIADSTASAAFKSAYSDFYKEWSVFYKGASDSWLTQGATSTYRKVQDFRTRLNAWNDQFKKAGGVSSIEVVRVKSGVSWKGVAFLGIGAAAIVWWVRREKDKNE